MPYRRPPDAGSAGLMAGVGLRALSRRPSAPLSDVRSGMIPCWAAVLSGGL